MPRIKDITVERVDLELTRPYVIAFKEVSKVENAIVTITLDNGVSGMGAANPSEQVVGENLVQAIKALEQAYDGGESSWQGLVGRDITELPELCSEIQQYLAFSPTARTALEVALYDCYGIWKKQPLVKLLNQQIEGLPTSITIGIMGVVDTLKEAQEYYERGFKHLKVKLGNDLEEDIERIIKLNDHFGNTVKIRVDANQGYSPSDTLRFYQETLPCNLELIEQPLPADQIEEMRQMPSEIRQILAADESLIGPEDADALIGNDPACGIFNIKLMKCGGISPALAIAGKAQQNDLELMWGCNDESIISIAAALHTALACKSTRYLDLDGSLDLASDVVSGGFSIENGLMRVTNNPGLGLIV